MRKLAPNDILQYVIQADITQPRYLNAKYPKGEYNKICMIHLARNKMVKKP